MSILGWFACLLTAASGARILAVFPVASVSHQVVFHPIVKELARRGHHMVTISPNPLADPSIRTLREINMTKAYDIWACTFNFALGRQLGYGPKQYTTGLFEGMMDICEYLLNIPEVTQLLADPSQHFDLVIIEWLFCPMMAAFSHRFHAPLVVVTSTHAFITGHDNVGNPTHPAYFPDFFLQFAQDLNFWDRLYSTYYSVWFRWYYYWDVVPREDQIARKYFGSIPYLGDIVNNVSLLLTNTNPILGGVRPLVPTTIEFGGMALHKRSEKPLPKDLQKYLDEADNGAVYFSLGTNVKSIYITEDKRKEILSAFAELPYKFLWKWESDTYEGLPENVKIQKWLPQQDILRHKNIKAFFMQGGLQSFEEAVLNQVPLVAMPFFSDQDYNVDKMVHLGVAVRLEINRLTKEQVKRAINAVVTDSRYRDRMQQVSAQVYDVPVRPLERVVWWIEYALRHGGTPHLRSPIVAAPFYKYFLLDILVFLILCFGCIIYVVYKFYAILARSQPVHAHTNSVKKNK